MTDSGDDRLPPGRQPYDPLNGLRIGALAGGIVGVILVLATPLGPWAIFAGAAAGGAIGYTSERRRMP